MSEQVVCPHEANMTKMIALNEHSLAVQIRVESGAEICSGRPVCEGPITVEIERNRFLGLILGKVSTTSVCPKVYNTIQK